MTGLDKPVGVWRSKTIRVDMDCGRFYITLNYRYGDVVRFFIHMGKSGGCQGALLQAVGRLGSIAIELGGIDRVVATLRDISCPGMQAGERGEAGKSCLDMISRILKEEKDNED